DFDVLWNLGDIVGYGASPNQVIDLIGPKSQLIVRCNHDRVCCGLTSALGFNPIARAAAHSTNDQLTPDNLNSLTSWPHGPPLNEDQYILNMRDAWTPLQQMSTLITLFGHTHVQGGFSQKEQDWHE